MDQLLTAASNLNRNSFQARIFDTAEAAKEAALAMIGDKSVGFGGSVTVRDTGLYDELQARGNAVHWHWKAPDPTCIPEIYAAARAADVYVCSSNAVLEYGALLNIDGTGNRVANMFDGPKTVIIIAGENKLAASYEEGLTRIKREACPQNARRLSIPTPCATSECVDCRIAKRMCRVTVLMERPSMAVPDVHIFLVRQTLGY